MKVGDLVKVYDFTLKARKKFRTQTTMPQFRAELGVDKHFIGLIVTGDRWCKGQHRKVLRSCDGETEFYNVARLEVINESR